MLRQHRLELREQDAAAIEANKAADDGTALFTSHGYTAAPDSPMRGWSKAVWETEWAPFDAGPFDAAWDDGSQLSGFTWAQFANYSRFIRPGAVRIGTTTSDAGLELSAFANTDGSITVVALNSAYSPQVATFSLRGLSGAHVTSYLTDESHSLSAQAPIKVRNSAFTATLRPRSLVSYDVRS